MMKQYFLQEEDGQGLAETCLMISLVAIAAIIATRLLGDGVLLFYLNKVVAKMEELL